MTLTVARIGLGSGTLGNLFTEMTDATARTLLETAWEGGIRIFDTAPHYGLGLAERRLGAFLAELGRPAGEVRVTTKVGRLLRDNPHFTGELDDAHSFAVPATRRRVWDPSEVGVRASLEESLERLGLGRVHALYLHDPDEYPDESESLRTGLAALGAVRAAGLVDQVGIGSKSTATLEAAGTHPETTELMIAGRFTLVDSSALEYCLPLCAKRGIRAVPAAIYGSGLLARPEPQGHYDYAEAPPGVVERARAIAAVCREHRTDLPTAALHYVDRHPSVAHIVLGARTPEQLRQSLRRLADPPPEELWAELAERGLALDPAASPAGPGSEASG